jgi:transcriptional pleiotropic regulator of transition state genes
MKSTGIVRKIDGTGRFCLPKELLKIRGIENGDPLEVYVEGEQIILQAYMPESEKKDALKASE